MGSGGLLSRLGREVLGHDRLPRAGLAARDFNESAMRRWSSLWASVRVDCHRKFGPGVVKLLAYAPEPQQRGAIHMHICLGARTPRERAALKYAARLLARRSKAHGWGTVDDRPAYQSLKHAGYAAAYLSTYLTKAEHAKSLRSLVLDGQAPTRAVYVTSALTVGPRCTMRNLRSRRYVFMLTRRSMRCPQVEAWLAYERKAALIHDSRRGGSAHVLNLVADLSP